MRPRQPDPEFHLWLARIGDLASDKRNRLRRCNHAAVGRSRDHAQHHHAVEGNELVIREALPKWREANPWYTSPWIAEG